MTTYQRPNWITRGFLNPIVEFLAGRLGLNLQGAWVLTVPGRRTGAARHVPVNVLELDNRRYLVAPRGETEWVRNLRAASKGTLRKGKTVVHFGAEEVAEDERPPVIRAYLRRWGNQAGAFFAVPGPDAPDEEFRRIAGNHPVFRLDQTATDG